VPASNRIIEERKLQTAAARAMESDERAFDPLAFVPARVNAHIAKRYKISKQEIGSGGFGKVFIAEDTEIECRLVAIKQVSAPQHSRLMFENEASVMKTMDHPNICKLLETYDCGESVFLVMEYCDGGNLLDRIFHGASKTRHSGLSEDMCANIIRQIAGALDHAHARGIAHRDLKPENVCLIDVTSCSNRMPILMNFHQRRGASEGRTCVKVIDWGVSAHFRQKRQRMRSTVGTVAYAAPEVLKASGGADGYTSSCDIWSLGVLAHVSLTGTFPFGGSSPEKNARGVGGGQLSVKSAAWAHVSALAKSFVSFCLRPDPSARPTASDVSSHKWLVRTGAASPVDVVKAAPVLRSLWQSSHAARPLSVYSALVARQLDHHGLDELPQVFQQLDADRDGTLSFSEFKSAFELVFGCSSDKLLDVKRTFDLLDLDGSGSIDYTEFIAAGLGERVKSEKSLKAAFKAFDAQDDDNQITRSEFEEMVAKLPICPEEFAVERVFSEFDTDKDGSLDFEEWKEWIHTCVVTVR